MGETFREMGRDLSSVWEWYSGLEAETQQGVLLLAALAVAAMIGWVMYQAHGDRAPIVAAAGITRGLGLLVAAIVVGIGKLAGRGWSIPEFLRRSWTEDNPDRPKKPETTVRPMERPKRLESGEWAMFAAGWKKLYTIGVISQPGSGKDEALIGPAIYHELVHGSDDLIVLDPKAEQLWRAYQYGLIPEDADLYVYGTSPRLERTHAFSLHKAPRPMTALRIFTEQEAGGQHFGDTAASLLMESGMALASESEEDVSLAEIAAVIKDPQALSELNQNYPRTVVAPNEREFGSVVSTARRALEPLDHPRARELFGSEGVRMPDFSSSRRQIICLCPDPAAMEESRMTAAKIEVLTQLAADSGEGRIQKFIMNEAGSFLSLPRLPHYCDMGRGQGVYMMYVLQSYAQLENRLGVAGARSLWTSSAAQIVGAGAEPRLAREMSEYTEPVRLTHRQPAQPRQSPGGEQIAEERRREIEDHHVTGLEPGHWIARIGPRTVRYHVPESAGQSAHLERRANKKVKG